MYSTLLKNQNTSPFVFFQFALSVGSGFYLGFDSISGEVSRYVTHLWTWKYSKYFFFPPWYVVIFKCVILGISGEEITLCSGSIFTFF